MTQFNIFDLLESYIGFKGLPFPGGFFPVRAKDGYTGEDFENVPDATQPKTHSNKGTQLRKADALGNWYFMPVYFECDSYGLELENAVISISVKKNIVETPLTGRRGSVKELISIEDYQIELAGVFIDDDYPEDKVESMSDLFNRNEAITLRCALTDMFFEKDDKIILTSMDVPAMNGVENAQIIRLSAVSDQSFELIIP